jgi:hypothetical protein
MKQNLIVRRRRARQGYYGSVRLDAPASVPPLTRPPPPGSLAFRFSSRESVAVQLQKTHPRILRWPTNPIRLCLQREQYRVILSKTLVYPSQSVYNQRRGRKIVSVW